jgi:hypothetical protein
VAGGWLLLDALHWTDIDFWEAVMPLGLVCWGAAVEPRPAAGSTAGWRVGHRSAARTSRLAIAASGEDSCGRRRDGGGAPVEPLAGPATHDAMAIMSGVEMTSRTQRASRRDDAATIWGGIEIWVPTDWAVDFRPVALMAGAEDQTAGGRRPSPPDAPVDGSRPRVIVRGFAVMGAIEIKNRPTSSLGA